MAQNVPNQITCIICSNPISSIPADITTHTTNSHNAYPIALTAAQQRAGITNLADAAATEAYITAHSQPVVQQAAAAAVNLGGQQGRAAKSGILMTGALNRRVDPTVGAGGELTPAEVDYMYAFFCAKAGYDVDRTAMFVDMAYAVVKCDATEEHDTLGTLMIHPTVTAGVAPADRKTITWKAFLAEFNAINKSENRRAITVRQWARYFGRDIMALVESHPDFLELAVTGTPVSQKYLVDQRYYYAVLSFFRSMKPASDCSPTENELYATHTSNVTKIANSTAAGSIIKQSVDPTGALAANSFARSLARSSVTQASPQEVAAAMNMLRGLQLSAPVPVQQGP